MVASFEALVSEALLDPERPLPPGFGAPQPPTAHRRFAVHRNNMVAGLVSGLRERFPVVEKIVGEEFFAAMARAFVRQSPPRSPVLARYGDELADFLAGFPPARELPYLADVARLEAARTRAYHAADIAPLDVAAFAALGPAEVDSVRLELHPSVEIVCSPHPIVAIWAMNSGARPLAPIDDWRGEDALVARPRLQVEVRALPAGGAAFLLALAGGAPLGEAAARALLACGDFDLTLNLAGLIEAAIACRIVRNATKEAAS
jgi:Putative DNA-binding domain